MPSLKQFSSKMLPGIEQELRVRVNGEFAARADDLRFMLAYHMGWEGTGASPETQGKRIRPLLVLLSAAAAGGDWHCALPAAAAVELLHNFSLIHDDIEDQGDLRHGRPTLWKIYGMPQAINAGDLMYTLAYQAVFDLVACLPSEWALRAARLFGRTCEDLTIGQHLDMRYETATQISLADYWPMVTGKTANLLGCSTRLGALSAGLPEDGQREFEQFGVSLGLAFQVVDDYLGIWGDTNLTGKSVESDLISEKKTLPVLYALEADGAFARRWRQGHISPAEVPHLASMLVEDGAKDFTLGEADRLTRQSLEALHRGALDPQAEEALRELADFLLKRSN
jgi:geranylgeranyl diphosphate synthase, type I